MEEFTGLSEEEFKTQVNLLKSRYSVFSDESFEVDLKANLEAAVINIGLSSNIHYKEKKRAGWTDKDAETHQRLYLDCQFHLLEQQIYFFQQQYEKEKKEEEKVNRVKVID